MDAENLKTVCNCIKRLFNVPVTTIEKDLTDSEAPDMIFDQVRSEGIQIDNLVNNAGIGAYGPFHEVDTQELLSLVQLNIATVTHLTSLYLQEMVRRDRGRVLNIASSSAFNPGPNMAAYNASKSYILLLTEAISEELRDTDVTASVMCPDATKTNFFQRMSVSESEERRNKKLEPEIVARRGYEGLSNGEVVIFTTRKTELKSFVAQALPRRVAREIATRNEKKRDRERIND
jgi:short-subunit dehydrogenase